MNLTLAWDEAGPDQWHEYLSRTPKSNPFQAWDYGEATRAIDGLTPRRAVIHKGSAPVGLAQIFIRKSLGFFRYARIVRGPLFFKAVFPEERVAALSLIRQEYKLTNAGMLQALPELPDGPAARSLLQNAGFRQVQTGYASAWLALDRVPTEQFSQGFRYEVRKARRLGLEVRATTDPRALLKRYDRHRALAGFDAPPGDLLARLEEGSTMTFEAWADGGDEPIAGVIFLRHGSDATYQVGWTTDAGRRRSAHNLLCAEALEALRAERVKWVDLGGLDWTATPGIARFKSGMGGEPFQLVGTYV